jgi:hypothetical protein
MNTVEISIPISAHPAGKLARNYFCIIRLQLASMSLETPIAVE